MRLPEEGRHAKCLERWRICIHRLPYPSLFSVLGLVIFPWRMLFCRELRVTIDASAGAHPCHEQLPGRSNCKGPPWAAVCSHSHRTCHVALLLEPPCCARRRRDRDERPQIELGCSLSFFPQAATHVRSCFLILHVFGLVMYSALIFKEYPSGLRGIFDSVNK